MNRSSLQESLSKFKKVIESLDLDKRIAATKWLEGVIVSQSLTTDERDNLVKAANEYIRDVEEGEYVEAVNALMEYFTSLQRSTRRALKKENQHSISVRATEQSIG